MKNRKFKVIPYGFLSLLLLLSACQSKGSVSTSNDGNNAASAYSDAGSSSLSSKRMPPVTRLDPRKASGTAYYISSTVGSDANTGLTEDSPWKTTDKLSSVQIKAGDKIYFKKEDPFTAEFIMNISGRNDNPIVISSYGSGNKPVFSGDGLTLRNASGIIINGLDFSKCSKGIWIDAVEKVENAITITDCDFHDGIPGETGLLKDGKVTFPSGYGFSGSGIVLSSLKENGIQNIVIENCNFYNLSVGLAALPIENKIYTPAAGLNHTINGMEIKNCEFNKNTGEASILVTRAQNVAIYDDRIKESGYSGQSPMDTVGLRIAACKNVIIDNTGISSTYAYADAATGSGVLLEGINEDILFTKCIVESNIGAGFFVDSSGVFANGNTSVSFENCDFKDNNTGMKNGNAAVFAEAGNTVSISGGNIFLHNNAQSYKENIQMDSFVNVRNASGKALQGTVPKDAVITTVKVGVAKAKITPEERTFLWGYTNPGDNLSERSFCNPQTDIKDDTWIKVMVFEDSATKERIIFVIGDMCLLTEGEHVPAGTFARWAKTGGISTERLFVSATHDHQGTGTLLEKYIARVDTAITEAISNLQLVKMGVASTETDLAISRRPNLAINEKLAFDNSLLLVKFTSVETGKPVTYITNVAIHNTSIGNGNLENMKYNTSELTGNAMSYLEKQIGNNFISVFINGAHGDAGPNVYGEYSTDYKSMVKRATEFGQEIGKILNNTPTKPVVGITATVEKTKVPYRPAEIIDFVSASVGDLAFFGVSGEIFSGIGASIKSQSPYKYTITTANTNAFYSYMPTYAAMHDGKGGYGVTSANNYRDDVESFVTQGALRVLSKISGLAFSKLEIASVMGAAKTQSTSPLAFDNNSDTAWETTTIDDGWMQCDLGSCKKIKNVALNFGNNSRLEAARDYDILVSDTKDFNRYRIYASVKKNTACQQNNRNDGVSGRYVRFVLRAKSTAASTTKIYEMSVYGE